MIKPSPAFSLVYHAFHESPKNEFFNNNIHSIAVDNFYQQLTAIKKKYQIISIDEMVEEKKAKKRLNGCVSISFDDGYLSVIQNALPVLEILDIQAHFFITTSLLDGSLLWRDKIRIIIDNKYVEDFLSYAQENANLNILETDHFYRQSKDPDRVNSKEIDKLMDGFFSSKGITLTDLYPNLYVTNEFIKKSKHLYYGNHTEKHYVLSSLNKEDQYREIKQAENRLKESGVNLSQTFSIPFGNIKSFNEDTLQIVSDLGYKGSVLSSGSALKDIEANRPEFTKKYDLTFINRFMPADTNRAL